MKRIALAIVIAVASSVAWSLPTLQQVEAEVQQGHTVQAQSMMSEVVAAKPTSDYDARVPMPGTTGIVPFWKQHDRKAVIRFAQRSMSSWVKSG